ncbi:MAG: ATP-grasp domain-containing protein [Planctomycetia bacterium]|nr:ATP-grasp domain-containing protein [Planctomycetia bacterium]
MKLLIYEHACAQSASANLPESVRREGRAMFDAVWEDAQQLHGWEPVAVSDSSTGFTERLYETARKADCALIIAPEFDGILQACVKSVEDACCPLLGPNSEAIRFTADKWNLYQHWQMHHVLTPMTWLPDSPLIQPGKFLRKHRYGAGSLDIAWWNGEQLGSDAILQEYHPGQAVSAALLIAPDGEITPLPPCKQHISTDGRFRYLGGELVQDEMLQQRTINIACQAVANIPGLNGYVGIDAVLGEDQDVAIEINPRLTTSYLWLRHAVTENLLEEIIARIIYCERI